MFSKDVVTEDDAWDIVVTPGWMDGCIDGWMDGWMDG